jgi:phosphatidate cytidylyltransferase
MIYVAWPMYCGGCDAVCVWERHVLGHSTLLAPWITDVAAYFTGSLIGRHKIVPPSAPKRPGKGALVDWSSVWPRCRYGFSSCSPDLWAPRQLVLCCLRGAWTGCQCLRAGRRLVCLCDQALGRDQGLWQTVFPGHGGVLDRFDSVLFTMPSFLPRPFYLSRYDEPGVADPEGG